MARFKKHDRLFTRMKRWLAPQAAAEAAIAAEVAEAMTEPQRGQPRKILVVDDDPVVCTILRRSLTKAGYSVAEASNGAVARRLIQIEPFDLVISDIRMPEVDGIELLRFVKAKAPIPVLMITGFTEIADATELYELGAAEFLYKPFKPQNIVDAVRRQLHEDVPQTVAAAVKKAA